MKKSIIALAVAGAMTAPLAAQADATLYGAVAVDYIDSEFKNNDTGAFQLDDTIIGVKASSEADGLTSGAQIQFEQGSTTNVSTTYANAYLAGDFGTVILGKIANPADDTDTSGLALSDSAEYGHHSDEIIAAAYLTPDMGGFSGYVGITADADGATDENTVDAYMAGVKFGVAGFNGHVSYTKAKENVAKAAPLNAADASILGVKVGYDVDALSLTAAYDKTEVDGDDAVVSMGIGAGYDLGATDLYAFHIQDDFKGAGEEKAKTTGVKVSHKLGTGASAYAEWSKTSDADGTADNDGKVVTLGYKVSF